MIVKNKLAWKEIKSRKHPEQKSTVRYESHFIDGSQLLHTFTSIADPHHVDADPDLVFHSDADPDPASHFDADPDPAWHFDADPDPTYHFDAE